MIWKIEFLKEAVNDLKHLDHSYGFNIGTRSA